MTLRDLISQTCINKSSKMIKLTLSTIYDEIIHVLRTQNFPKTKISYSVIHKRTCRIKR